MTSTSAAGAAPRETERQGVGLAATPPKTVADRRRGTLGIISLWLAGRSHFWKYDLWLNMEL